MNEENLIDCPTSQEEIDKFIGEKSLIENNHYLQQKIEKLAPGLSPDDICFYIWDKSFDELVPEEQASLMKYYRRGQIEAQIIGIDGLKAATTGRQGYQASRALLEIFAEQWKAGAGVNKVFSFTMVTDD